MASSDRPPHLYTQNSQSSGSKNRYTNAVRLAASATATFFGLSPGSVQPAESQKWERRRAELRRRFASARQASESEALRGTTTWYDLGTADQFDGLESGAARPQSVPATQIYSHSLSGAIPVSDVPLVYIKEATPQRGQMATPITPASIMSTTSGTLRSARRPKELYHKEGVPSMAFNSLRQAVRRQTSKKNWSLVHDADVLPSPTDTPLTPMTPASFLQTSMASATPSFAFSQIPEHEELDQADASGVAASRRAAFASQQVPALSLEEPPTISDEDVVSDLFYDLPRSYFVQRGLLENVNQVPMSSRLSHLSAITEVHTSSTSSLPMSGVGDETDFSFQPKTPECFIPSAFDDPDMVPKLSALEGVDSSDGIFSDIVEKSERSTLPFRLIARCLGRNYLENEKSKKPKIPQPFYHRSKSTKTPTKVVTGTFDSSMFDNRAFFTYWITLVHIAIFLFSVISYGIAPFGLSVETTHATVLREWGVPQRVSVSEPQNPWIGPSQASLVHLGARYTPCMRSDSNINEYIESEKLIEEESGCCVRNDRTGCIQSTKSNCADALATWLRWSDIESGHTNTPATSLANVYAKGPVCGLDPEYCLEPASIAPFTWSANITNWPICTKRVPLNETPSTVLHMTCDIIGRPCCVGLVGKCILTTREYCEFQNGYFHQEAFLCTQVSCMGDICGMIPFADPQRPDQFYRLWTSLFLHAGIIHLLISILFQMTIMRQLEKYAGWIRISVIYLMSGLVGNLASAIFTPYHAEAGPTGSHFGLLACLAVSIFVDIVRNRDAYKSPLSAIIIITATCFLLFSIGLLPFVDNWAHVFGFAFGAILACMLLPDVELRGLTRLSTLVLCFIMAAGILAALVLLFYFFPVYECEACAYFNCIPFTSTFCATRRIALPML